MRRLLLVVGALIAFGFAILLAPAPEPGLSGTAALGRSLGGLRVVAVDALFFRAEALRRRGDIEDVPALYNAVLEIDPGNEAAFYYLAEVYAYDVIPEASDADDRYGWWREAWEAIGKGLAAHPGSERLHLKAFDLLRLAAFDPGLEPRARAQFGDDPLVLAFRHLRKSVILGDGRGQLLRATIYAPVIAAERLRDGKDRVDEILEVGRVALDLRRPVLDQMSFPDDGPAETFSAYLDGSLAVVAEVERALAAGDRAAARAAIDAYAAALPRSLIVVPLRQAAGR